MPTEPLQQRARSKIVATVGPACNSPRMLALLADAGADVFRLNTAHGTLAEHDEIHRRVRTLSDTIRPLGVLVDLAGPKIQLALCPGDIIACEQGASFEFIRGEQSADPRRLVCNYRTPDRQAAAGGRRAAGRRYGAYGGDRVACGSAGM